MQRHAPATQTLYAQLVEAALAREVELAGGFANGLAVERTVRHTEYLYWQLRDLKGALRQVYLGPARDPAAIALRDALVRYKKEVGPAVEEIERLTAAYVASGGARHIGAHFRVVDALARAGLFRMGVVLVGSHAFVSIGAALGVSWSADVAGTADVDLCRDEYVTVACDEPGVVDLPGVLKSLDPSFFLVPELDLKAMSTSIASRKGVKLDLLTTARTPRDARPRVVAPFGLAAQPLRYMDYLVRADVQRGLFIGARAIPLSIPHPGRFALHKLAVAARREGGPSSIKADKDRRQAALLIEALAEVQPGAIDHAVRAARQHRDRGLLRDIGVSLPRLPDRARERVRL